MFKRNKMIAAAGFALTCVLAIAAAGPAAASFKYLERDSVYLGDDGVHQPYEATEVTLQSVLEWSVGEGVDAGKTMGQLRGFIGYFPSMSYDPGCGRVTVDWLNGSGSVIGTSYRTVCVDGYSSGDVNDFSDTPMNRTSSSLACARVKLWISEGDATDPTQNDLTLMESKKVCAGGR